MFTLLEVGLDAGLMMMSGQYCDVLCIATSGVKIPYEVAYYVMMAINIAGGYY